jgi:flavin-dependent dehydrogenase
MENSHDLIIIGAGPAGSTLAILSAQAGLRVALVERENFPRFRIGESLLPEGVPLLNRLGVLERMEREGYQRKPGALFSHEPSRFRRRVSFADAMQAKSPHAYQVERAPFDALLLERARECGVQIFQPCNAERALLVEERVTGVHISTATGKVDLRAPFLVDASGRSTFLVRQIARQLRDPILNQTAAFSVYDALAYPDIAEEGDIEIIQTSTAWIWVIPLGPGKVSVGAVWTKEQLKSRPSSVEQLFLDLLAGSPMLQERIAGAQRIAPIRTVADYSYQVEPAYGPGWMTLGDAAAFVDPVFSSGVFLAMRAAEKAFEWLTPSLARGQAPSPAALSRMSRYLAGGLTRFKRYIYGYYTPGFQNTFYSDPPFALLRRAVASQLAGNVFEPAWYVRALTSIFWWNIDRFNRRNGAGASPRRAVH